MVEKKPRRVNNFPIPLELKRKIPDFSRFTASSTELSTNNHNRLIVIYSTQISSQKKKPNKTNSSKHLGGLSLVGSVSYQEIQLSNLRSKQQQNWAGFFSLCLFVVIGIFSLRNSIQQNSAADSGRDVPARKKPDEEKNGFQ